MREVRDAIAGDHPFELLAYVSSLLNALDPRSARASQPIAGGMTLAELTETFLYVDRPETIALVRVLAAMAPDELLRARLQKSITGRRAPLPSWLDQLDAVSPVEAVVMQHGQPDGENVIVGVHIPPRHDLTLVIYVDHNVGTLVKDAFCLPSDLPKAIDDFHGVAAAHPELAGPTFTPIELADARARVVPAIALAAETSPPFESDSWPASRALIEWILRLAPTGGVGYQPQTWTDDERTALAERFFASPYGRQLRADDHAFLLDEVIAYGAEHATGDPLHMSPVTVEMIMMTFADSVIAPIDAMAKLPGLLSAYVGFAHAEQGLDGALTEETLAAVDHWEPRYFAAIESPMSMFDRLAEAGVDVGALLGRTAVDSARAALGRLAEDVGGHPELDGLTTEPLPDEPFHWASVRDSDRARVEAVVTATDRACDAVLDVEHRTACRRLIAELAAAERGVLHKGKPEQVAAAVCWLVGRANHTLSGHRGPTVKELLRALGETQSPSQRAYGLLRAIGRPVPYGASIITLGTVRLLVSTRRRHVISMRDHYRETIMRLGEDGA